MSKKRWVGLRSASFRRTLLAVSLILLFSLGFWLGRGTLAAKDNRIELLDKQLNSLENELNQIKESVKNKN